MTENEKRVPDPIRDLLAEIGELRREMEEAADEARELAEEVYSDALADFHGEQGARRITALAEEHGLTFVEALEKFGNLLHPRPPGYAAEPRAGAVVEMSDGEREERQELKRVLASRDLSGLTEDQRAALSLSEQEFFTRPRDGQEEA